MEEIDRKLFVSLCRDTKTKWYYILNDGYYVKHFYADSDYDAKIEFRNYLNRR